MQPLTRCFGNAAHRIAIVALATSPRRLDGSVSSRHFTALVLRLVAAAGTTWPRKLPLKYHSDESRTPAQHTTSATIQGRAGYVQQTQKAFGSCPVFGCG
jgi:hypothetical protein